MYRGDLDTDQGQHEYVDALLRDGEAELEFKIRELAAGCVGTPDTYGRGTVLVFQSPMRHWGGGYPLPPFAAYNDVHVRLHPGLRNAEQAATLVAEHIIRDALLSARLEADCG